MRWQIFALLALSGSGVAGAQPLTSADWKRAIVNMAADPKYADNKITIGTTKAGSVWSLKLTDLADVYKTAAAQPKIWVTVDASKDKSVPYRRRLIQFIADCQQRTYDTPAMVEYAPNGAISATDRHQTTAATMEPVPPNSMADTVVGELCDGTMGEIKGNQ